MAENQVESSFIRNLKTNVSAGTFHSNEFYQQMKAEGTPVVETEGSKTFVHFIYFGNGQTKTVHVLGSFPGWDLADGKMENLEGTQIWAKSYILEKPLASSYYFSVNDDYGENWQQRIDHFISDPLNPHELVFSESPVGSQQNNTHLSYFAAKTELTSTYLPSRHPEIKRHSLKSKLLHNERNIWVYDPEGNAGEPKNLLIVFDGFQYTEAVPVPNMIDELHSRGEMPSTIMIGIDSPDRFKEFSANDRFLQCLTEEVLPWVQEHFNVSKNPEDTALCGASLGGLTAFYAAVKHPDKFGKVLSQSGSLNRQTTDEGNPWIADFLQANGELPVEFYMNAGCLESDDLREANRIVYQTLKERGNKVAYEEFQGGHDLLWWRETFLEGLRCLFSKSNRRST